MYKTRQTLYCYADETGQDTGSDFFIVVVVVVKGSPDLVGSRLVELEEQAKLGNAKWHKSNHAQRVSFLSLFLNEAFANIQVYFGVFKKPTFYFFPLVETLAQSIKNSADAGASTKIYVDGLDRITAKKITVALRSRGLRTELPKGVRDESDPLIRLADRWAGCIRLFLLNGDDCKRLVKKGVKLKILIDIKTNP